MTSLAPGILKAEHKDILESSPTKRTQLQNEDKRK